MKQKHNAGFSLVEILVAIVLLGAVVVPTCTSLVLGMDLNGRTAKLMKAQLAVSSAVETLMAEGITASSDSYTLTEETSIENGVEVKKKVVEFQNDYGVTAVVLPADAEDRYYTVNVTSDDGLVSVRTTIRAGKEAPATEPPTEDAEETGGDAE